MDYNVSAMESGEYVIGIFLDFNKAFDTVNHQILLNKLFHYGIRGTALKWFTSYLSGRKQFISFDGAKSSESTLVCGVHQGLILGPLLFLIYVNDMGYSTENKY
jgi:hypothetical protein